MIMADFQYEIVEEICVLTENAKDWINGKKDII